MLDSVPETYCVDMMMRAHDVIVDNIRSNKYFSSQDIENKIKEFQKEFNAYLRNINIIWCYKTNSYYPIDSVDVADRTLTILEENPYDINNVIDNIMSTIHESLTEDFFQNLVNLLQSDKPDNFILANYMLITVYLGGVLYRFIMPYAFENIEYVLPEQAIKRPDFYLCISTCLNLWWNFIVNNVGLVYDERKKYKRGFYDNIWIRPKIAVSPHGYVIVKDMNMFYLSDYIKQ